MKKENLNNKDIIKDGDKYLMSTYKRFPVYFVDGYNSTLIDSEGKEYIDFLSGIAVNSLGYSNKRVRDAMIKQAETLVHSSNYFYIETQVELAKLLCENSFADKAFFGNSGAEANEGAIKLARKRAYLKYGENKNEIVSMKSCFHGRTLATLSITDNESYREGYGPHPEGFKFAVFNNIENLESQVGENTAAIIIEPIQGEGGVNPVDLDFLKKAKELSKKFDCALIYDEIQCGMGRTGKLFAYENYGIEPDIMTLAKALGNGIPIGAILAKGDYADVFTPGAHGTTFGGNQMATGAAQAVVNEMIENNIPALAEETGNYFKSKLNEIVDEFEIATEVRGMGLLLGLQLSVPGASIVSEMLERGFIINCTQEKVLRFIPPLIITKEEIDEMIKNLKEVLGNYK
ncbi:MAG: aspartate aminotransferase family protein [Tissierellia bacterium]|nr:aspartate aminotransferase family protein [Tissierellia bacterium]